MVLKRSFISLSIFRGSIHYPIVLIMSLREAERRGNLPDYLHFITLWETATGCIAPLAVTPGTNVLGA